jgi:hypothetical protein
MVHNRLLSNLYTLTALCNILSESTSWSNLTISLAVIFAFTTQQVLHPFLHTTHYFLTYKKLIFKQVASCSDSVTLPHSSRPSFILWPQFALTWFSCVEEGVTWDSSVAHHVHRYDIEEALRIAFGVFCKYLLLACRARDVCFKIKRTHFTWRSWCHGSNG